MTISQSLRRRMMPRDVLAGTLSWSVEAAAVIRPLALQQIPDRSLWSRPSRDHMHAETVCSEFADGVIECSVSAHHNISGTVQPRAVQDEVFAVRPPNTSHALAGARRVSTAQSRLPFGCSVIWLCDVGRFRPRKKRASGLRDGAGVAGGPSLFTSHLTRKFGSKPL